MQGLSLVFALFSLATAFHHHHHMHRALSLSLPTSPSLSSLIPSVSLSLPLSLPTPPPSSSLYLPSPSPSAPTSSPPSPPSSPSPSSPSSASPLTSTTPSTSSTTVATTATSATTAQSSDSTPTSTLPAAGLSNPSPASSVVVIASATITPSTAAGAASPGFFSNTGAVAGTFTAVGLIGIAGVIAVALFILKRRHSRSYEDDTEFLDKSLSRSSDPPMNQVTSLDDGFTSDHGHYSAAPMAVAPLPAAYYPDNTHTPHAQAFSPDPLHHAGYTQDFNVQHLYFPDDYDIAYPPTVSQVGSNMPNPHEISGAELASAPVPLTQAVPPTVLHPSVRPSRSIPRQWENTRFSVDSFYVGIDTDHHSPNGQAL